MSCCVSLLIWPKRASFVSVCVSVFVWLHNNQRHWNVRACVWLCESVFVCGFLFLFSIYEQQRDRSLVYVVWLCVCVICLLVVLASICFSFFVYLFSVSLITTQLKHQSSYSRAMFMYISVPLFSFLFPHSVHGFSA